MKKILITSVLLSGLMIFNACSKKKDTTEEAATTESSASTPAPTASAEPTGTAEGKTYTVTVTPEITTLGKEKQATIKIKNLKLLELSNPDGAVTGSEFSYELEVTNNTKIGGNAVYFSVSPSDFRLELDNGTKISHRNSSSLSVDPESTKSSTGNIFDIPAGAKPVTLNLFFDETRASVKIELK